MNRRTTSAIRLTVALLLALAWGLSLLPAAQAQAAGGNLIGRLENPAREVVDAGAGLIFALIGDRPVLSLNMVYSEDEKHAAVPQGLGREVDGDQGARCGAPCEIRRTRRRPHELGDRPTARADEGAPGRKRDLL